MLVSRLGLGCSTFGREIPETAAFALMDYAVAHGITLFDTAEAYGGGQARAHRRDHLGIDDVREVSDEMHSSEKIIGRWLCARGGRRTITLVSKISRDFRFEHVRSALEASLSRLQTDYVDLYLYHSFDPTTPLRESNVAMDDIVRAGLARAGGCSNYSGAQIQAALDDSREAGLRRFEATQLAYNLLQPENDAFLVTQRESLGVLAYSPLAAGFLSGKYTSNRAAIPKGTRFDVVPGHVDVYFSERNFRRVALLHRLAEKAGVPALQLAMSWVLQNPAVTTVLVGARTEAHLANALAAERLTFLPEWLAEINAWDSTPASKPLP